MPTLHCCKHPCFWRATGSRQLAPDDPRYLFVAAGADLYLNLIDGQERYFQKALFDAACLWLGQHDGREVLVHCNQGLSRAPAVAMVYLARIGELPDDSLYAATAAYQGEFFLSPGIMAFLEHNWAALMAV